MAVAMIGPLAAQRMVVMPSLQRLIVSQRLHDGREVVVE